MVRTYKQLIFKNAGQYFVYCLAFLFLAESCSRQKDELALRWEGKRAVSLIIPIIPIRLIHANQVLTVKKKEAGNNMLGSTQEEGGGRIFTPLVPFTQGTIYEAYSGKNKIGEISVPYAAGKAPVLTNLYPSTNLLPENLLKIYLQFSAPMQQGSSLAHISLRDSTGKQLYHVFLDLQPELWDTTGTVLTVWLDPGRIKRGLELNKSEGNPLHAGKHYQVVIDQTWKDTRGVPLQKAYMKRFTAGPRDDRSPDLAAWSLQVPVKGESSPIFMYTAEPLDHFLMPYCVRIYDEQHRQVKGTIGATPDALLWKFIPAQPWAAGNYSIEAALRLEDLAGNNFERLFDRDLRKPYSKPAVKRGFRIE